MNKRIHIATFGCQMNDYESDRTYRLFREMEGYEWIENPEEADLVLFNTCSIREKADHKAMSALGWLRSAKKQRPEMVIAVGGCMAQAQGSEIQRKFPYVDIVFGTHQWNTLPSLVKKARVERERSLEIDLYGWKTYQFLPYKEANQPHPVCDIVTVQNGCNKFCTFCLVPFTRGRETSRAADEILNEVRRIVENGARDITLLGQNVNAYGTDRRGEPRFSELLSRIAEVDGLERIRFVTSHPSNLTRDLIDAMADNEKVCEHLHLPIQSGSDRILERMRRDYDIGTYRKTFEYLQKRIPNISITTDFIIGFPSETDDDFEDTLRALAEFDFEDSFSFCYSPRPFTKAAEWCEDFVAEEVADERLQRLQAMQHEIKMKRYAKMVGSTVQVLVEGEAKFGGELWRGRTRGNATVNFSGAHGLIGKTVPVRLEKYGSNTFIGHILVGEEKAC